MLNQDLSPVPHLLSSAKNGTQRTIFIFLYITFVQSLPWIVEQVLFMHICSTLILAYLVNVTRKAQTCHSELFLKESAAFWSNFLFF